MKLPIIKGDNTFKIKQWINETGRYCDVFIGSSSLVINSLRETDWSGKVIFIALGSMPRGATSLRNCYRNLFCDDVIWFTSESDKEIYSELFSKENSPQPEVIPFGIHTDVFYPIDEKNIKSLRKKYDLECSDFILLYSGRITIEKNVHGILESLAFLVNMNLPVKLVIVGRIEDNSFYEFKMAGINIKSRIEKIIKKLNITSQVIFIDWVSQEQLNEFYNIANVIVNYSLHHDENYGFSQIQAMATGKPVIGTAWGGFKDYIIDGVTGFSAGTYISDFGIRYDMPSLVRAIFELYKDSNFSKELGKNGLDYVNSNFSFKIYKERMISLVERVTNNNKLRGNHLTLTDFGTKFHERFSYKEDDKLVSLFPQYSDLADDDYKRLIKPYTSYDHFPENKCNFFLAIVRRHFGFIFCFKRHPIPV